MTGSKPRQTVGIMGAPVPGSLSLCMILKDEAHFIARCLESVREFVDEMVLVDTGSSDATVSICRQYVDHVHAFTWQDDFAAARNFSIAQANSEWILVLDADEVMQPDDLAALRRLISATTEDAFLLTLLNYSDDATEKDWQPCSAPAPGWSYKGYRAYPLIRLFRNREDIRFKGTVHEVIDLESSALSAALLDLPIHHDASGNPQKDKGERQRNYLRIMEAALLVSPDGRLAAKAGAVRMYHLDDCRGAIAHFQMAADLDYDRTQNLEAIAEAHYRLAEYDQACAAYAALYAQGYASASLCNNYSNLLVKREEFPLAIEVLERALVLGQAAPARAERIRNNIAFLKRQLEVSP